MVNAFRTVLPFVVTALLVAPCPGAEPQPASARRQYVYVLELTPDVIDGLCGHAGMPLDLGQANVGRPCRRVFKRDGANREA